MRVSLSSLQGLRIISQRITEYLILQQRIPYNILPDKGTHFIAEEMGEWAYDHAVHWSYHILHHSEAGSLIKHWSNLLITELGCYLRQYSVKTVLSSRKQYMH